MAYEQKEGQTSAFNTAVAQMQRIAETQAKSNQYQFDRDFSNWAKCVEILYKEIYSKCAGKEISRATKLLGEMNKNLNAMYSSIRRNIRNYSADKVYAACWNADLYIRRLMNAHKFDSPEGDDPNNAAYGKE